jgi:hypothetical protein
LTGAGELASIRVGGLGVPEELVARRTVDGVEALAAGPAGIGAEPGGSAAARGGTAAAAAALFAVAAAGRGVFPAGWDEPEAVAAGWGEPAVG